MLNKLPPSTDTERCGAGRLGKGGGLSEELQAGETGCELSFARLLEFDASELCDLKGGFIEDLGVNFAREAFIVVEGEADLAGGAQLSVIREIAVVVLRATGAMSDFPLVSCLCRSFLLVATWLVGEGDF